MHKHIFADTYYPGYFFVKFCYVFSFLFFLSFSLCFAFSFYLYKSKIPYFVDFDNVNGKKPHYTAYVLFCYVECLIKLGSVRYNFIIIRVGFF